MDAKEIFCTRLKAERKSKKLTQEKLGVMIGLDEGVANTRISRYEKGIHTVEPNTGERIASVLDVPLAYFYAGSDDMAELLKIYHHLNATQRTELLEAARQIKGTE